MGGVLGIDTARERIPARRGREGKFAESAEYGR